MATITINNLPPAVSLDGTEWVPIAKDTGSGYVTEKISSTDLSNFNATSPFVVAVPTTLPNARLLESVTSDVTITDNGAGASLVLSLPNTAVTAATYGDSTHFLTITVDAKGRITSATNLSAVAFLTSIIANLPTAPIVTPTLWLNGGILTYS
ncbi:hypothetical protein [Rhizobium lusitanum]|uniref:Phage tail protein n=1 Tax=Rhizobium lusitanum TaxID=293958 RepID=A0A1C3VQX1_9HYPH|nr:hypothetical protein [Rhizobium lusitanum]SCB30203.1 hypothetical protein GA0061101_10675 [Rhizobium lusitanum]